MRVRRGLLFWGLFLIPLGAIPLIVRAGGLDGSLLADIWRLWPLILIAVGIVIVIGRTRAAVLGTAVIALTLGMFGGAVLAAPLNWFPMMGDCRTGGDAPVHVQEAGTFADRASVVLDFRCGKLEVSATDDPDWRVDAEYARDRPTIEGGDADLAVRSGQESSANRDEWKVRVPSAQLDELRLNANAATGIIDLGAAQTSRVTADLNAIDLRFIGGSGGTDSLHVTMNAGRFRLETGAAPMSGSVSLNAGAFDLCVPSDVGLRLDITEQLTFAVNLNGQGLEKSGSVWTREAAAGNPTVELSITGNAAALTLNGEGACR